MPHDSIKMKRTELPRIRWILIRPFISEHHQQSRFCGEENNTGDISVLDDTNVMMKLLLVEKAVNYIIIL